MTLLLFAAIGTLVVIACVVLEERDRAHVIVFVLMGALVLDSLVYPGQAQVPVSLFRLGSGGAEIRFVDALIPAALLARLLVRGLPRRVTGQGLLWGAFFAVYAFGAVVGLANHQPSDLLVFQAKFVVECAGMAILVAGIPADRWTRRNTVRLASLVVGILTLPALILALVGADFTFSGVPLLLPDIELGRLGSDAATVLLSLGALLVIVELCSQRPRPRVIAWCLLMMSAPIFTDQRAAMIGLGVVLFCVLVVVAGRYWRRRSRLGITQLFILVCAALLPLAVFAIVLLRSGESLSALPFASNVEETFTSTGKVQSADIRLSLWREGLRLAEEDPLWGRGLGQEASVFQNNGTEEPLSIGDFHNIVVDVAVRIGAPGLALFLLASASSIWACVLVWRRAINDAVAALAIASAIVFSQLIVKGLVESIFQKYRLAVLIGFVIGLMSAVARSPRRDDSGDLPDLSDLSLTAPGARWN